MHRSISHEQADLDSTRSFFGAALGGNRGSLRAEGVADVAVAVAVGGGEAAVPDPVPVPGPAEVAPGQVAVAPGQVAGCRLLDPRIAHLRLVRPAAPDRPSQTDQPKCRADPRKCPAGAVGQRSCRAAADRTLVPGRPNYRRGLVPVEGVDLRRYHPPGLTSADGPVSEEVLASLRCLQLARRRCRRRTW